MGGTRGPHDIRQSVLSNRVENRRVDVFTVTVEQQQCSRETLLAGIQHKIDQFALDSNVSFYYVIAEFGGGRRLFTQQPNENGAANGHGHAPDQGDGRSLVRFFACQTAHSEKIARAQVQRTAVLPWGDTVESLTTPLPM